VSNCIQFCRCIQGHLKFHLSLTSICINGIDTLDASETLRNPTNMKAIRKLTHRDLLHQIKLDNNMPLFLQLSQHSTGDVDAVILNTTEA
jgi:hypothetical protein